MQVEMRREKRAYEVLSHPERRARYYAALNEGKAQPSAMFHSLDFLHGVEGEGNRRLTVLALPYRKCHADIHKPQVSLQLKLAFSKIFKEQVPTGVGDMVYFIINVSQLCDSTRSLWNSLAVRHLSVCKDQHGTI